MPIFPKLNGHAVNSKETSQKENAGKELEQGRQRKGSREAILS